MSDFSYGQSRVNLLRERTTLLATSGFLYHLPSRWEFTTIRSRCYRHLPRLLTCCEASLLKRNKKTVILFKGTFSKFLH
jgi:hypothetical protein